MSQVMSPRIVVTVTGSDGHAPLPSTVNVDGTPLSVWTSTGSFSMGLFPAIEYRDHANSRLVVVQRVNSASYDGNPALLSIAWVPVTVGDTVNPTYNLMSSQFRAEGLIHKSWATLVELVADSSAPAVAAKAAWPDEWNVSGSLFIGAVLA